MLFDRSGGQITKEMSRVIEKVEISDRFQQQMIRQVKEIWDAWNLMVSSTSTLKKGKEICI